MVEYEEDSATKVPRMPLEPEELAWIVPRARDNPPLFPEDFADRLPALSEQFAAKFGKPAPAPDLAAAAACAAYGPPDATLTAPIVAEVIRACALDAGTDPARLVERVLVHGLRLPAEGPAWHKAWPRAWDALREIIRVDVLVPLAWLHDHVLQSQDVDREAWVGQTARASAALLAEALVHGCDCWRSWASFAIESPIRGLYTCVMRHSLSAWGGRQPLGKFVWQAVVQGQLGEGMARVNDFRRGMLAKADLELTAGRVLRCQHPTGERRCHASVLGNDRCSHPESHWGCVKNEDWWLWRRDSYRMAETKRCLACSYLYFQFGGHCPWPSCPSHTEGEPNWSAQVTRVWRPARVDPFAVLSTGPAVESEPDPRQQRVREEVAKWRRGPERTLAERVFCQGQTLAHAAEEMRLGENQFQRLLKKVVRRLQDAFGTRQGQARGETDGLIQAAMRESAPERDPLENALERTGDWNDDVGSLTRDVLANGVPQRELAARRNLSPSAAEFRLPLLEGVLRLAVWPRLQRLMEVQAVLDALDEETRNIARRLFFPKGGEGYDEDPVRDRRVRRVLHQLAQRLYESGSPLGSEEDES